MTEAVAIPLPVRAGKSSPPLGTLWLGDSLPQMELICLLSMVAMRWDITLFSYGPIDNLPAEIPLRDAREVYPENLSDPEARGHLAMRPAMFSDIFRLHMIEKEGLVWVDSDFLVVAEDFPPVGDLLFCDMPNGNVNNAVLYAVPDHPFLQAYKSALDEEYPTTKPYFHVVRNAEITKRAGTDRPMHCSEFEPRFFSGPIPMRYYLEQSGCADQGLPTEAFYPISYKRRRELWRSNDHVCAQLTDKTVAIHLWGSFMRHWFEEQTPGPDTFFARRLIMLNEALSRRNDGSERSDLIAVRSDKTDAADTTVFATLDRLRARQTEAGA